ncbi:ATP-binding protein [Kineococcus sp. NBC_00420]|uniref:AlbA family DNA-binding domain-containing protein n=1 Tax=Kineococcus sp. NBC_00420 TaxID=2903564 RepID=UPI002E1BBE1F
MKVMAYYLGPDRPRWTPTSWDEVVQAAADGVLDETTWVELKQDIPSASKGATTELARDLASLALYGGILIVGIADDAGRPGEVIGVRQPHRLVQRIDQVAHDSISPPVTVHSAVLTHPDDSDLGVVLVVIEASPLAPHMADGYYRGRGDTGKRKLTDPEIRLHLDRTERQRANTGDLLKQLMEESPAPDLHRLHFPAHPLGGRNNALEDWVHENPHELRSQLLQAAQPHATRWDVAQWMGDAHQAPDGATYSLVTPGTPIAALPNMNLQLIDVDADGTLRYTLTNIASVEGHHPSALTVLSLTGVESLSRQLAAMIARVAHLGAITGSWGLGMAVTNLYGSVGRLRDGDPIAGSRCFPHRHYVQTVTTTSSALAAHPAAEAQRLTKDLRRVLTGTSRS